MLVLTRKKGERVMIGDDIVVTLIDIRGDGPLTFPGEKTGLPKLAMRAEAGALRARR